MYSKIINPETGEKVSVNTKQGKIIIRSYLNRLKGGAGLLRSIFRRGGEPQPQLPTGNIRDTEWSLVDYDFSVRDDKSAVYNPPGKVVVIGDIHGDYSALISSLNVAKLIEPFGLCGCANGEHEFGCEVGKDEYLRRADSRSWNSGNSYEINRWRWIGGDTYLVLLGDMVDRYRQSLSLYREHAEQNTEHDEYEPKYIHTFGEFPFEEEVIQRVLNNLREQAEVVGGKVIKIIGNHERFNLMGDYRYVTPYARNKDIGDHERFVKYSSGGLMFNLLKGVSDDATTDAPSDHLHCVAKVGKWIFMHGGLMTKTVHHYASKKDSIYRHDNTINADKFISRIDEDFQNWLHTPKVYDWRIGGYKLQTPNDIEDILGDGSRGINPGILWERAQGYLQTDYSADKVCNDLGDLRNLFSDQNIKIGIAHCNQFIHHLIPGHKAYVNKRVDADYEGEPHLCGTIENQWMGVRPSDDADKECSAGVTHICGIRRVGSGNGSDPNGSIWRLDVGMSRGFDIQGDGGPSDTYNQLKSIVENIGNLTDNNRAEFLARRPQILETNATGTIIKVKKASKSLPRGNCICPYELERGEKCIMCTKLATLDFDRLIMHKRDIISQYASIKEPEERDDDRVSGGGGGGLSVATKSARRPPLSTPISIPGSAEF